MLLRRRSLCSRHAQRCEYPAYLQEIAPIPQRVFALHSLRLLHSAQSFDRVTCPAELIQCTLNDADSNERRVFGQRLVKGQVGANPFGMCQCVLCPEVNS